MRAVAVAVLVLLAAACSTPSSGEVVAKDHRAPYSWTQMVCSAYGKNGVCSVWVPIVHNEPECWQLKLRSGSDRWDTCTTKTEWDEIAVGDSWSEEQS
jgi:hypothetical protein